MAFCGLETKQEILQRKYGWKTDEGNVSSKNSTHDPLLQFLSWCFYCVFELPHNPSLTLFFCQLSLTMTFFISSVHYPIFETEYNTGNLVSVLKETMENDYCLPKT